MPSAVTVLSPDYLVFADVDETLINCKSMFDFLDHYLTGRYGDEGAGRAAGVRADLLGRAARGVPRAATNRTYYRAFAGEDAARVARWGETWFAERSAQDGFWIAPTARALARHVAAGAALVLVSGSFPALLDPVAQAVGAAHVVCTTPEVRDGILTGALAAAPVIGEGKRHAVRSLLARYPEVVTDDCFAYGDHASDLPMLAEVGHPVVVGEDPVLIAELPRAGRLGAGDH